MAIPLKVPADRHEYDSLAKSMRRLPHQLEAMRLRRDLYIKRAAQLSMTDLLTDDEKARLLELNQRR